MDYKTHTPQPKCVKKPPFTVEVPGAAERLAAAGVRTAVRAGRVRASFHVYNTDADVDAAVAALTG